MSATTDASRPNERLARVLVSLAYRAPLLDAERIAYEARLLDRLPASLNARSLLRARHIALLPRTGSVCSMCAAASAFVVSTLSGSYEMHSRSPTCAWHSIQLVAAHFLLTLPTRCAEGGPWTEDAIRTAVCYISDARVCVERI